MEKERIRVLLIEDDRAQAQLLKGMLATGSADEYRVTAVAHVGETRSHLVVQPWDVVVLDLAPPGCEPVRLVQQIKELAPDVPLVLITGADGEALARHTTQEQAQDHLVKGQFDGPQLVRVVREAMERSRAEQQFQPINHTLRTMDQTVAQLQKLAEEAGVPRRGAQPPA